MKPAAEVFVIRLDIMRPAFLYAEPDLQRVNDRPCDLFLDRDNLFRVPVVGFGPDIVAGSSLDELREYAQTVAVAANTSLQHGRHAELLADGVYVLFVASYASR